MKFRLTVVALALSAFCGASFAQTKPVPKQAPAKAKVRKFSNLTLVNTVNPACTGSTNAPHCWIGTWTAPTTHTDGTPITGALTYDLLRATVTNGVAGPFTPVLSGIVGTSAEDDTIVGGATYEYEVLVHEAGDATPSAASAPSIAAVVPVAPPSPTNAPTGVVH
jgi:hypothetical protein